MTTYRWSRYNINAASEPSFQADGTQYLPFVNCYKTIAWNGSSWVTTGSMFTSNDYISAGTAGYYVYGNRVVKYVAFGYPAYASDGVDSNRFSASSSERAQTRGTYVSDQTSATRNQYPDNGISGSYWYVYQGVQSTAPTTPGAFTQPSGSLEIGDTKAITWGASSDAEGNLTGYTVEVALNGSSTWTQIGTPTSPNINYTIPTCTSIQFRVKARDSGGLESGWRTSSAFTVTKPTYYWSKYNSNLSYGAWSEEQSASTTYKYKYASLITFYTTVRWDGSSYVGSNPLQNVFTEPPQLHGAYINVSNGTATASWLRLNSYTKDSLEGSTTYYHYSATQYSRTRTSTYVKGSLVQSSLIAVEGSYPTNGRHTDGYWYVRGSRASQSIAPPEGIISPAADTVFRSGNAVNIVFTASTAANVNAYEVDYRYNNDAWISLPTNNTLTRSFTTTTDSTKTTFEFRVRAKNTSNVYSDYIYSPIYTIQHNQAPTITPETIPSGSYTTKPSFKYTISDADGDAVIINESIDGIVFNTYPVLPSSTPLTYTPSDDAWLRTRINETVNITITANDGKNDLTTVTYPITRAETAIDLQIKNPFETDVAASRLLLQIEGNIPADAIVNVQVCNNAFDTSPTWENATNLVLSRFPYPFSNKVKTADKWGISFKIRVERGGSTQPIYIDGIGGAFD